MGFTNQMSTIIKTLLLIAQFNISNTAEIKLESYISIERNH
ncbi:hypothetical protein HJ01_03121 [Flavobacterium frigoris PS1]|uniref:Uncharacterized protein n=1 Tax=Flavobacterium frigoris (strain PS1) TaxID=1086011 RepID=H7FVC3_FLAFP|nr:hypothetical protein HJ01_03121 [Flavobacterium frigoris PS1]